MKKSFIPAFVLLFVGVATLVSLWQQSAATSPTPATTDTISTTTLPVASTTSTSTEHAQPKKVPRPTTNTAPTKNVRFTVGGATLSAHVDTAEPVLDLMNQLAASGAISYTSRDFPGLGAFVESINGGTPPTGTYWILSINGTTSSKGISTAIVSPGDTIEWKFSK